MKKDQNIITKGVIAVAGSGTRFLPVTKTLPKEMLPIVDKPIVQYVVEEMVQAGITDIIFVTRADKKILEDYFDHNTLLEDELLEAEKWREFEEIKRISNMANFIYIRQKGPYGNGTPVLNASSIIGNEPFVFAYGDDLVKSKGSFTKQLIENYAQNRAVVLGCQEVLAEEVSQYGIMKLKAESPIMEIEEIVEKPLPEDAPSRLAVFGRFVLVPEICEILRKFSQKPKSEIGKGGELWLTDAIEEYIRRGHKVVAQPVQEGQWYTTGDALHFLKVVIQYALDREEFQADFRKYLESVIRDQN